jgi:ABC-2 type transport system permease protein
VAVQNHWQDHLTQQQQRTDSLNRLSFLSPSLMLQLAVNRLANSGGEQHMAYIKQVADHHQQIREYLYPYLYGGNAITPAAIDAYPRFNPAVKPAKLGFNTLGLMAALLLLMLLPLYQRFRGVPLI